MIIGVVVTDNRKSQIGEAIKSFASHVDQILLVDTGVTDGTIDVAVEAANGTELTVVRHEWVDFSAARNAGLKAAEEAGATWILLVDTDERIDFGAVDFRVALRSLNDTPIDVLMIESDDGMYPKDKIVRAGCGAEFYGPTHEALVGISRRITLRGVRFNELPKTDEQLRQKFERDVAILEPFIEAHPDDARWHYYLAQSYEGLGDRKRAAKEYAHCAELRKTGHEAAWARFKQADQLYLLKNYDECIAAAAIGLGIDPTFGECAWIASVAALKKKLLPTAVAWARMAESVGRYRGCGTERAWFRYLPALYELPYAVLCESLPDEAGRDSADLDFVAAKVARIRSVDNLKNNDLDWMSVSPSIPPSNREEARTMLRPGSITEICESAQVVRIQFEPPDGRLPMNPSICMHKNELICVVRAVNYSMHGRHYIVHDPNRIVRTTNYIGKLGLDGSFTGHSVIQDLDPTPRHRSAIVGYEDIRLVSVKGVLSGSATVCDRDPEGRRMIAKLDLDAKRNVKRAHVQKTNQLHEKNWMPLSNNGEFAWIYSLDPTAILPGPLHKSPLRLEHLRGGAAIPFKDGYLCVTHEVIDDIPETRVYLHRFVKLDSTFKVQSVSESWIFSHYGIEFCAGLVQHKGQLLLSYGVADREAWLMKINTKDLERMKWITP